MVSIIINIYVEITATGDVKDVNSSIVYSLNVITIIVIYVVI